MEYGLHSLLSAEEDLGRWAQDEGKILKISCLPPNTGADQHSPGGHACYTSANQKARQGRGSWLSGVNQLV